MQYEKNPCSCPFCGLLEMFKFTNRNLPKNLKNKYKVLVKEETYRGNCIAGTSRHGSFELNYCPVCGVKVDLKEGAEE